MAIIIHPKRWANQPPVGAQIDFGHPLAEGLTFYVPFNAGAGIQKALLPAGLPGNSVGILPSADWISTPGGQSHNFNGNWSVWFERGIWVEPPTAMTAVIRLRRTGTAAAPLDKTANNGGSAPFAGYAIEWNPGGAGQDTFRADIATGGTLHTGSTISLGSGFTLNQTTVGMSYISGSLKAYANGINKTNDSFSGSISYDTTSTGRLIISGASTASALAPWFGQIYYVGVWNRVLTPTEMEWMHMEPYAMLVPTKRKKFFLPSPARAFTFRVAVEKII